MNAVPQDLFRKADELSAEVRQPFPASRKIYVEGSRGVRVPMREISLTATRTAKGIEPNPPVTVYDTSGPYSDPETTIDLRQGLAPLREAWIAARGDTELLRGPSSIYG
ncbi:MAG: phosphomethylpyrimidine synthase ThiC, partial [Solimonas sp.]